MSTNIFGHMKKKDRKEFSKLQNEQKAEIIQSAIVEKISPVMTREIATAIVRGSELERERIYNRYVKRIDDYKSSDDSDRKQAMEELLSYLRVEHLKYAKKHAGDKNK